MRELRLNFDDKILSKERVREVRTVLKPRCETVVRVPTNSEELATGLISKTELLPGVDMADFNCSTRGRMPYKHSEHE